MPNLVKTGLSNAGSTILVEVTSCVGNPVPEFLYLNSYLVPTFLNQGEKNMNPNSETRFDNHFAVWKLNIGRSCLPPSDSVCRPSDGSTHGGKIQKIRLDHDGIRKRKKNIQSISV